MYWNFQICISVPLKHGFIFMVSSADLNGTARFVSILQAANAMEAH